MTLNASTATSGRDEVDVAELADEVVLMHPREANPGHYDAITAILARAGLTPRLRHRQLFDAAHTPVAQGSAVCVVGESTLPGLPGGLTWRPLRPAAAIELHLLTRGDTARPGVGHLLRAATETSRTQGWLRAPPDAGESPVAHLPTAGREPAGHTLLGALQRRTGRGSPSPLALSSRPVLTSCPHVRPASSRPHNPACIRSS